MAAVRETFNRPVEDRQEVVEEEQSAPTPPVQRPTSRQELLEDIEEYRGGDRSREEVVESINDYLWGPTNQVETKPVRPSLDDMSVQELSDRAHDLNYSDEERLAAVREAMSRPVEERRTANEAVAKRRAGTTRQRATGSTEFHDAPQFDTSMALNVTGLSDDDERLAVVKGMNQQVDEAAEFAQTLGEAYTQGHNQASVAKRGRHLKDAREGFDENFRSQLSEAENALLDAYIEQEAKAQTDRDVGALKTAASFMPVVGLYIADKDAVSPSGPGGISRRDAESRNVAFEAAFTGLDFTPLGLIGDTGKAGVRLVAPTHVGVPRSAIRHLPERFKDVAESIRIRTGGVYLDQGFTNWSTTRLPERAPNAYEQSYNAMRTLAEGKKAVVELDGEILVAEPSPLAKLLSDLNPGYQVQYYAGNVGGFQPGRIGVRPHQDEWKQSLEIRTYNAPGDPARQFLQFGAFGDEAQFPGILVSRVDPAATMPAFYSTMGGQYRNIIQMRPDDIPLLEHRMTPDAEELKTLLDGGFDPRTAYELASKPHIAGARDRPGKGFKRQIEGEDTQPTAVGRSEFVGVLDEFVEGPGFGMGTLKAQRYAPEDFVWPSYSQRFGTNMGAIKQSIIDTFKRPSKSGYRRLDDEDLLNLVDDTDRLAAEKVMYERQVASQADDPNAVRQVPESENTQLFGSQSGPAVGMADGPYSKVEPKNLLSAKDGGPIVDEFKEMAPTLDAAFEPGISKRELKAKVNEAVDNGTLDEFYLDDLEDAFDRVPTEGVTQSEWKAQVQDTLLSKWDDEIAEMNKSLDDAAQPVEFRKTDDDRIPQVAKELPPLTEHTAYLIELSRKSSDDLKANYPNDPVAQHILETRRQYDARIAAERAGEPIDDAVRSPVRTQVDPNAETIVGREADPDAETILGRQADDLDDNRPFDFLESQQP